MDTAKERLFSLDLLRGLDMWLLAFVEIVIRGADRASVLPKSVSQVFTHTWGVFTIYDVIMPCFIFMCGAAIPFALGKRLRDGRPTPEFWKHLAWRFVMLYVLGSICQCNLLSLDPMRIHVFYNTLQVIAVAYVSTALVMLIPSRKVQVAIPIVLALVMGVLVHLCGHGDYTQTGNFTYVFDRKVWGLFLPAGQHSLQPNGYYTYLLPQLACSAITMCGYECSLILRSGRTPWLKAAMLGGLSAILFVSAFIASFWIPVIKHIFSLSFSLYATAWSVLALAVLYVLSDIWKLRRGTGWILLFGRNALFVYVTMNAFHGALHAAGSHLAQGAPLYLGSTLQPFIVSCVMMLELVFCVYVWNGYKQRPHRECCSRVQG